MKSVPKVKQVWLADDASATGNLTELKAWYSLLMEVGSKHGYYVNKTKTWLVVKDQQRAFLAEEMFEGSLNITSEGKRLLGAVVGSRCYKDEYCNEKVLKWKKQLINLCQIAESHPQLAYAAYRKGFLSKFTYFLRTIDDMSHYLKPIDELVSNEFLPKLFGLDTPFSELRNLFSLRTSDGGLGLPILQEEAVHQYHSSVKVTTPHVESIVEQKEILKISDSNGKTVEDLKAEHQKIKQCRNMEKIERALSECSEETGLFVKQAQDKGASAWLNAMPVEELGFNLNKEQFWDALKLRYGIKLENLPFQCPCGQPFDVSHALSCKKGGFIAQRHDNIKNLLVNLLAKVCKNVESEPHLLEITSESLNYATANTSDEARLDIKAQGFWQHGQVTYFDVRVTHVNAASQKQQPTA